jgi:hypothetical protein
MNQRNLLSLSAIVALALFMVPGAATAQQKTLKEQVIGTWIAVSNDSTTPDGKKEQLFGPNPKGILVFDASGQWAQIIVHPDVPKFKVNNRLKGTAEENTAAVHGTTATFGTWTLDEANKTINVRYVGGMFPNQAGTEGKRTIVNVTPNELKLIVPTTATGARAENTWRRAQTVASR